VRIALVVVVAVFVLIQFVPYAVDHPSARDEPNWDSPQTRALVQRSCADCHSNQTRLLWFEHIAPVKWYIANHVKEGRAALNFSQWPTAAGEDARRAPRSVANDSMPPSYYTWFGLHGDSKLTSAEVQQLVTGLQKTIANDPPTEGNG
jgi:mono/diheme cytochrome c family protein